MAGGVANGNFGPGTQNIIKNNSINIGTNSIYVYLFNIRFCFFIVSTVGMIIGGLWMSANFVHCAPLSVVTISMSCFFVGLGAVITLQRIFQKA